MERLRSQAGRVTRSRQAVLEALLHLHRPATPKEIADAVGKPCDLATVYRSLSLFEGLGLVQRVDFGDGLARFEVADEAPGGHHHHHLLCRRCQRIVQLDDCILAQLERDLSRRHGFRDITHRLEFFGVCPSCQDGARA